jgi:ribosomal protein L21
MQIDLTLYRPDEPLIKAAGIKYQTELYTSEQKILWDNFKGDEKAQCPKCGDCLTIDPVWVLGDAKSGQLFFSPCSKIACVKCDYIKRDKNDKVLLINYNKKARRYR